MLQQSPFSGPTTSPIHLRSVSTGAETRSRYFGEGFVQVAPGRHRKNVRETTTIPMATTIPIMVRVWSLALCACLSISLLGVPVGFAQESGKSVSENSRGIQSVKEVRFGQDVLPIFASRCFPCHGPATQESGFRLDRRDAALGEAESGMTPIIAGNASESELLRRLLTEDADERMPPEQKPLSEEEIGKIRSWIDQGAKWEAHWAFQSLSRPQVPEVSDAGWVRNPIDSFILKRLEDASLEPAPPADKVALLRRVYFDLTGLPPTLDKVDAFLADNSPDAYEHVVDELLASPHYGERWARHWLDVVRYAETNSFERDNPKPHAWRYRDYVIRSFNQDKPYDQFVKEQLAGDELDKVTADSLVATGFYRLGLWDDEPADRLLARFDALDDIVSTTGQAFLGITINCARCHDHKLDPILQSDYYGMLAFFNNITPMVTRGKNIEVRLPQGDEEEKLYKERVRELAHRRQETQDEITQIEEEFRHKFLANNVGEHELVQGQYLEELKFRFYRDTWDKLPSFDELKAEETGDLPKGLLTLMPATRNDAFGFVFTGFLKVPNDGEYSFSLNSDDGSRLTLADSVVIEYDGLHGMEETKTANISLKAGRVPFRFDYFQRDGGRGIKLSWSGPNMEPRLLTAQKQQGEAKLDRGELDLANLLKQQGRSLLGDVRYNRLRELHNKLNNLNREKIPANYGLCVTEHGSVAPETHILSRGNPHVPASVVEPGFPSVLDSAKPEFPPPHDNAHSTGRRRVLAQWIASPENKLTARVMVNRIWQHHFGRGIVRSPNNFGYRGDPPTHPGLLDYLATEFIRGDWKMKPLHRLIVTSNSYRMSSRGNKKALAKDPSNDLFWRVDMRRLSAEEIRDSIHAVSGELNLTMYGPSVYPEISKEVLAGQSRPGAGWGKSSQEEQARRSIYIHLKRSLVPPILANFDLADLDTTCPVRFSTTQPTQALGMLNGHLLNRQAEVFAQRLLREAGDDTRDQVRYALRLALSRPVDEEEVRLGVTLIRKLQDTHGLDSDHALRYFCLVVLNMNEFIYLD